MKGVGLQQDARIKIRIPCQKTPITTYTEKGNKASLWMLEKLNTFGSTVNRKIKYRDKYSTSGEQDNSKQACLELVKSDGGGGVINNTTQLGEIKKSEK